MKRIYECINLSIERISDFLSCRMEGYALRKFLFGKDVARSVGEEVTMNCNANVAKSNVAPGSTAWIEDKDARGGHKATQQLRHLEHRVQSACPSTYHTTTLGKRTRTNGSSVPSTRLVGKPLIDGWMERQRSAPYDMARREPMENCGGMPMIERRGTQHSWGRAEQTLPVDPINPKRMRNTGAFGKMHYSETNRAPYVLPIAHPTYASNIGNWMSSDYVRESDIATTLATPMVYHPSHPRDQLHKT